MVRKAKKLRRRRAEKRLYKSLIGSHKKQADAVLKHAEAVNGKLWVSIDPGSNSLGYAVRMGHKLLKSGEIKLKGSIGQRLGTLIAQLHALPLAGPVELVAVEFLRTSTGHVYLTWSAGAAVGALMPKNVVEISTGAWKRWAGPKHAKTDEADAIAIGEFCIQVCKEHTSEHIE